MELFNFFGSDPQLLIANVIGVLVVLAAIVGISWWDRKVAEDVGVHTDSPEREFLIVSEMAACGPVPQDVVEKDPVNAIYDTEYSYPEMCPPIEKERKPKTK